MDYISAYSDSRNPYHREARSLVVTLSDETTLTDGVLRWNSNSAVPPEDCVALALWCGMKVDVWACNLARQRELDEFLAEYRKIELSPEERAEHRAEARAAFGPGVAVVNVISGQRWRT